MAVPFDTLFLVFVNAIIGIMKGSFQYKNEMAPGVYIYSLPATPAITII
jgi:hypothetical protein